MVPPHEKKVVCIIPARYGSTRLPGKPLLKVDGIPLIVWTYSRAVESKAFEAVYVATDDERIFNTVEKYNGKAVMTSKHHVSGTDRVFEAIGKLDCSHVVNLQGDEPLLPVDFLNSFSRRLVHLDNLTLLTCVSNATIEDMKNPNVVKVVFDSRRYALYFSRSPIPFFRDETNKTGYKHFGIYGFSRQCLERFCHCPVGKLETYEKLEQLRALEHGMKIHCMISTFDSINIDSPEDLATFRSVVERQRNIHHL